MHATPIPREFVYNGRKLPDPDPTMRLDEVQTFYATMYPEIATASRDEDTSGAVHQITFRRAIGAKG